jgi:uncharacterized caspase-like protein
MRAGSREPGTVRARRSPAEEWHHAQTATGIGVNVRRKNDRDPRKERRAPRTPSATEGARGG